VAIAMVNRHPQAAAHWKLNLRNFAGGGQGQMTVLSGDSPDAYNGIAQPNRVTPQAVHLNPNSEFIEVPAHSVAVAQFSA
jgi:alpha-L-arabinofuranosidase